MDTINEINSGDISKQEIEEIIPYTCLLNKLEESGYLGDLENFLKNKLLRKTEYLIQDFLEYFARKNDITVEQLIKIFSITSKLDLMY